MVEFNHLPPAMPELVMGLPNVYGGPHPPYEEMGRCRPRLIPWLVTRLVVISHACEAAMGELGLSASAHDKVLRVARTMADLDVSDEIKPPAHRRGRGISLARLRRICVI